MKTIDFFNIKWKIQVEWIQAAIWLITVQYLVYMAGKNTNQIEHLELSLKVLNFP